MCNQVINKIILCTHLKFIPINVFSFLYRPDPSEPSAPGPFGPGRRARSASGLPGSKPTRALGLPSGFGLAIYGDLRCRAILHDTC